jgi:hypothetical protein
MHKTRESIDEQQRQLLGGKKILCFLPVHQRHEILKVCLDGLARFGNQLKQYGHELIPFVVYSSDADKKVLDDHPMQIQSVQAPNDPLGAKLNIGLRVAIKIEFNYFFQMGSDDLLSIHAIVPITKAMQEERKFFGFTRLAMLDVVTQRTKVAGYLSVFGAGRFIRKDVLVKASDFVQVQATDSFAGQLNGRTYNMGKGAIAWVPAKQMNGHMKVLQEAVMLWEEDRQSALDNNSEAYIEAHAGYVYNAQGTNQQPYILDIKGGQNIHSYDNINVGVQDISINDVVELFPEAKAMIK